MASELEQRRAVDQSLVRVVAHPVRVQALSILAERPASPKEIAAELKAPVGNVSYHVRELEQVGLIELVDEKKRRGAIEHFYRAVSRPLVDDSEWEKLSTEERRSFWAWIIQLVVADASQALDAGTFDARNDCHLSRIPLLLDEEGWRELVAIQAETLQAILDVQASSAERLGEAEGGESIPATASLMCFEMPPKRRPAGADQPPSR